MSACILQLISFWKIVLFKMMLGTTAQDYQSLFSIPPMMVTWKAYRADIVSMIVLKVA